MIADLNAYHAFISSLKVPQITDDFANLKMLGHVFIVSDAKDLAQIVRDVTRYGGSFRPEVMTHASIIDNICLKHLFAGHLRVHSATQRLEEDREDRG